MTLTDALALKAGDIIHNRRLGGAEFIITSAFPARPEQGFAPSVVGFRKNADGTLARHNSVCIILDDGAECRKALSGWTK